MRWPVTLLLGYFALGLEWAVRPALALGHTGIAPSFVVPFVVFIAAFASSASAMWTAVLMGLAIDLTSPRGTDALLVPGPHALGLAAVAYFVLTVRGVMIRKNPLVHMVLSVLGTMVCGLVVVAILTFRRIYGSAGIDPGDELLARFLSSLLTALSALLIAGALFPLMPVFGFQDPHGRRFGAR